MNGSAGNDVLDGGADNDNLLGGAGADSILGGIGADTITGGSGADTLIGGAGVDSLTGGSGADRFVFATADLDTTLDAVTDVIGDFNSADADVIAMASGLGSGSETSFVKAGATAASLTELLSSADNALDGTVKYYLGQVGSNSYLVTDADGDGYTDVIQLTGVTLAQFNASSITV